MRSRALAALLVVAGCTGGGHAPQGGGSQTAAAPAPLAVTDVASAEAALGKLVEVRGQADDAMLGAEITVGRVPFYCDGVDRWPSDITGTQVVARGTLARAEAEETDPALPSSGATAATWHLQGCQYTRAR